MSTLKNKTSLLPSARNEIVESLSCRAYAWAR